MRAGRATGTGGLAHLAILETPQLQPGAGEVRVRIGWAALNHLDLFVMKGAIPNVRYPQTLGSDGAGIVEALGEGVTNLNVGDRVALHPSQRCGACEFCVTLGDESLCPRTRMLGENCDGTYAEYAVVRAVNAHRLPTDYGLRNAAALGVTYLTAWRMLITKARLRPGEIVLILGIGGGVSLAALDIARRMGAQVWVTSSDDEKLRQATERGAAWGVNYRAQPEWDKIVRERTGKRGVDIVIESVGKASWLKSLNVLRYGGQLVTCGATTGHDPQTDIRRIFWKQLTIHGSTMGTGREYTEMLCWAAANGIVPAVDQEYPLEALHEAEGRLERGEQFGKVLIAVDPSLR